jgi:hypothetical protein
MVLDSKAERPQHLSESTASYELRAQTSIDLPSQPRPRKSVARGVASETRAFVQCECTRGQRILRCEATVV